MQSHGSSTTHGLNGEQLKRLRSALDEKRDALLAALASETREVADPEPGDAADMATSEIARGEQLELAARQRALLAAIEHALAKFEDGTYGLSERSGRPIPYERLLALPWATTEADER